MGQDMQPSNLRWKIQGIGEEKSLARKALSEVESREFDSREAAIEAAESLLQSAGLSSVEIWVKTLRVDVTTSGGEVTSLVAIDGYKTACCETTDL